MKKVSKNDRLVGKNGSHTKNVLENLASGNSPLHEFRYRELHIHRSFFQSCLKYESMTKRVEKKSIQKGQNLLYNSTHTHPATPM